MRRDDERAPSWTPTRGELDRILTSHVTWTLYDSEGSQRADLSGADLRGVDLSSEDLRGALMANADLRGASLKGTYLVGAVLVGCLVDLRAIETSWHSLSWWLESGVTIV